MTLRLHRPTPDGRDMDNIRGFYREAVGLLTYAENQKFIFFVTKEYGGEYC